MVMRLNCIEGKVPQTAFVTWLYKPGHRWLSTYLMYGEMRSTIGTISSNIFRLKQNL
jgi:hypothetical protein